MIILYARRVKFQDLNMDFFKTKEHKRFNYKPRFYDERKMQMGRRILVVQSEPVAKDLDVYQNNIRKSAIRGQFRSIYEKKHKVSRKSNHTVLFLITILVLLTYYFLIK